MANIDDLRVFRKPHVSLGLVYLHSFKIILVLKLLGLQPRLQKDQKGGGRVVPSSVRFPPVFLRGGPTTVTVAVT